MKIGILAIQGDFALHKIALDKLSVESLYVRNIKDLIKSDALILPGGESTTISLLFNKYNLFDSIKDFAKDKSIFGTCAGAILMSCNSNDLRIKTSYDLFNTVRLTTLSNKDELIEKYRFASRVEDSNGAICHNFLKNNWD